MHLEIRGRPQLPEFISECGLGTRVIGLPAFITLILGKKGEKAKVERRGRELQQIKKRER